MTPPSQTDDQFSTIAGKAEGTIDHEEIARFSALAAEWWDPEGKFKPLHKFNPVRLGYIRDRLCSKFGRDLQSLSALTGLSVLDIGCGGGLVAEPMARMGASVTGIDAAPKNVATASTHAAEGGLNIDYRSTTAEALASESQQFDVVLSLEIVEHVADVPLFLASCAALVRPGGVLVMATLNRTAKSFVFAIVGAEYIMRWLPRGTHQWEKFLRPSELTDGLENNGMSVCDITGVTYNPLGDDWQLSRDLSVNYMLYSEKPDS
jgi:2-polyprenyl-6-hydroxyphenyl methylase/3-demethylubiquinone-9 3-methyltransferase